MSLLYRTCVSTPQIITFFRLLEVLAKKAKSLVQVDNGVYRRHGPPTCSKDPVGFFFHKKTIFSKPVCKSNQTSYIIFQLI